MFSCSLPNFSKFLREIVLDSEFDRSFFDKFPQKKKPSFPPTVKNDIWKHFHLHLQLSDKYFNIHEIFNGFFCYVQLFVTSITIICCHMSPFDLIRLLVSLRVLAKAHSKDKAYTSWDVVKTFITAIFQHVTPWTTFVFLKIRFLIFWARSNWLTLLRNPCHFLFVTLFDYLNVFTLCWRS